MATKEINLFLILYKSINIINYLLLYIYEPTYNYYNNFIHFSQQSIDSEKPTLSPIVKKQSQLIEEEIAEAGSVCILIAVYSNISNVYLFILF